MVSLQPVVLHSHLKAVKFEDFNRSLSKKKMANLRK